MSSPVSCNDPEGQRPESPKSEDDVFFDAISSQNSFTRTSEKVFDTVPSSPPSSLSPALASLSQPLPTPPTMKKRVSFDVRSMRDPFMDESRSSPNDGNIVVQLGATAPTKSTSKSPSSPWRPHTPALRPTPPLSTVASDTPGEIKPPRPIKGYEPLPMNNNPPSELDGRSNGFLKSKRFVMMCKVAIQQAHLLPVHPPPIDFVSVDETPMHQWYESLVTTFSICFAKRLRDRHSYPQSPATYNKDGQISIREDAEAFNAESVAHVKAIFRSFNVNWSSRPLGSTANLCIDVTREHAGMAAMALRETIEPPSYPPKFGWKAGEPLHHYYRGILRRFRGGVLRLIGEREECTWILAHPDQLERGLGGYEEFYIRSLRRLWVEKLNGAGTEFGRGAVRKVGDMQVWEWQ